MLLHSKDKSPVEENVMQSFLTIGEDEDVQGVSFDNNKIRTDERRATQMGT
jgi:hypothetical protein